MSLRIPPFGVLSYIPSCKIQNPAAVFAVLTAKWWMFFRPAKVFCTAWVKDHHNVYSITGQVCKCNDIFHPGSYSYYEITSPLMP